VTEIVKLSYTKLRLHEFCRWAYKLRYIDRIRPTFHPRLLYGANVHAIISNFLGRVQAGHDVEWSDMEKIFNDRWRDVRTMNTAERNRLRQAALNLLRGFWTASSPDFGKPLLLEERFSLDIGADLKIEGVVDRVEQLPAGGVEVIDYKSGSSPDRNLARGNRQLLIYAMACREAWSLHPQRVSLYYLACNTTQSWLITRSDIEDLRETIVATGHQIRMAEFHPRTGTHCTSCDFIHACNYGQAWVASSGKGLEL